jgi:outer membrane lipoprotein-sorting protein
MRTSALLLFLLFPFSFSAFAQPEAELVKQVRAKLDQVNNYSAEGNMKIDVSFIKAAESKVEVFYKKPDKFKVKKQGGISLLPKGGVSINLNSIITTDNYTVVPAGEATLNNIKLKVVKLLPTDDNSEVVLTTLYIDEKNKVIRKSKITTRESGTYEMEMQYGKYIHWGLPDKVVFSFNVSDYKLPKGVTFEYDDGKTPKSAKDQKDKKGKVEISYTKYVINKGVDDSVFK